MSKPDVMEQWAVSERHRAPALARCLLLARSGRAGSRAPSRPPSATTSQGTPTRRGGRALPHLRQHDARRRVRDVISGARGPDPARAPEPRRALSAIEPSAAPGVLAAATTTRRHHRRIERHRRRARPALRRLRRNARPDRAARSPRSRDIAAPLPVRCETLSPRRARCLGAGRGGTRLHRHARLSGHRHRQCRRERRHAH